MGSEEPVIAVVVSPGVEELRRRVEHWRRTRRRRGPMPAPLWESAVGLARRHGVSRVARRVRLGYHELRKRLDSLESKEESPPDRSPAFIEMQLPFSAATPECLVEIERLRGERLRIHVKGVPAPELAALIRGFLGRQS